MDFRANCEDMKEFDQPPNVKTDQDRSIQTEVFDP
jgi:hypothetical protein